MGMNMLNSVVVVGNFKHYTSKKGTLPLNFILENNNFGNVEKINVSIQDEKLAKDMLEFYSKCKEIKVSGTLGNKGIKAKGIDFTLRF